MAKKTPKKIVLGIDIGGSGIKGALVDTETGLLASDRHRIATPKPADPVAVGHTVKELIRHFDYDGPVGIGFPARVIHGNVKTATNIDKSWIDTDAQRLFGGISGMPCFILNDADAAGLAEMRFGAGKSHKGLVFMVTVGTGIGTALFTNGVLVPNTELGHLRMFGDIAEAYASDAAHTRLNLTWKEWGSRFNEYLSYLEFLFSPDLFIIGGGVSKKFSQFENQLTIQAKIVPARLENQAGIVGAAAYALGLTL